jgi:hypothetical protein
MACMGVSLIGLWAVVVIMVMACVLAMVMLVCGRA